MGNLSVYANSDRKRNSPRWFTLRHLEKGYNLYTHSDEKVVNEEQLLVGFDYDSLQKRQEKITSDTNKTDIEIAKELDKLTDDFVKEQDKFAEKVGAKPMKVNVRAMISDTGMKSLKKVKKMQKEKRIDDSDYDPEDPDEKMDIHRELAFDLIVGFQNVEDEKGNALGHSDKDKNYFLNQAGLVPTMIYNMATEATRFFDSTSKD